MTATGTGLSEASPKPFAKTLRQNPSPKLGMAQAAYTAPMSYHDLVT
ncbi:hypothetical protein OAF56_04730 [Pirellulaceae bacterium]|nr:hypothetical protein [Pirellulaceae bacterium]